MPGSGPQEIATYFHTLARLMEQLNESKKGLNASVGNLTGRYAPSDEEKAQKKRKEAKFQQKLLDLKKRTRTDAYRRQQGKFGPADSSGGSARFGDRIRTNEKHAHEWGRVVENEEGVIAVEEKGSAEEGSNTERRKLKGQEEALS